MRKPLRLWPGVIPAAVLLAMGGIVPFVLPAWAEIGQMAAFASAGVNVTALNTDSTTAKAIVSESC